MAGDAPGDPDRQLAGVAARDFGLSYCVVEQPDDRGDGQGLAQGLADLGQTRRSDAAVVQQRLRSRGENPQGVGTASGHNLRCAGFADIWDQAAREVSQGDLFGGLRVDGAHNTELQAEAGIALKGARQDQRGAEGGIGQGADHLDPAAVLEQEVGHREALAGVAKDDSLERPLQGSGLTFVEGDAGLWINNGRHLRRLVCCCVGIKWGHFDAEGCGQQRRLRQGEGWIGQIGHADILGRCLSYARAKP